MAGPGRRRSASNAAGQRRPPALALEHGLRLRPVEESFSELAAAVPEVAAMDGFDQHNPWHAEGDLGLHTRNVIERIRELSDDPDLVWVAALHDTGKPAAQWFDAEGWARYYENEEQGKEDHEVYSAAIASRRLAELGMDPERAERICQLVRHHGVPTFASTKSARRWLERVGPENAEALLTFAQADWEAEGDPAAEIGRLRALVTEARTPPASRKPELAIGGRELISSGVKPGPEMGRLLSWLEREVGAGAVSNEPEALLEHLKLAPAAS